MHGRIRGAHPSSDAAGLFWDSLYSDGQKLLYGERAPIGSSFWSALQLHSAQLKEGGKARLFCLHAAPIHLT